MALSLKVPKLQPHVKYGKHQASHRDSILVMPGIYREESTFKITVIIHLKQVQLGCFMSNAL